MNVIDGILKSISDLAKRVGRLEVQDSPYYHSRLSFGTPTELTIADGSITVTKSYHLVDTEADAASDDLVTIVGGATGDILILQVADPARTVVAKDTAAANSLLLAGDFSMDSDTDTLVLIRLGTYWIELSRSDNAA